MVLEKLITTNKTISAAISTIIAEYDIQSAYATALRYIKGEDLYQKLSLLPKLERNITIGKMLQEDNGGSLYQQIESKLLFWMNEFLRLNNVQPDQFVETTRDSIMLVNKIPSILTLDGGKVKFINKEGVYTSLFRVDSKLILFDSTGDTIRIKGINDDEVQASPFIRRYFKPFLRAIETSITLGRSSCFKQLDIYRSKYIQPNDPEIYKDLNNQNKYMYLINDEMVQSDFTIESHDLIKIGNYVNYVMPIVRLILTK